MLKNFENQNNKEENKLKPHQPPDDDSVKGKSIKNYRVIKKIEENPKTKKYNL